MIDLPIYALLGILACLAFVQNMAFTWVSRSRNGGDVQYHRFASWASNSIWFLTQVLLYGTVWTSLTQGEWWKIALTLLVYTGATTEGSCLMMRILLSTEAGKRKVGAS